MSKPRDITRVVHLRRRAGQVVSGCDACHYSDSNCDKHLYVGRECKMGGWDLPQSKWANPFSVNKYGLTEAIKRYKEYVMGRQDLMDALDELEGNTGLLV